MEDVDDLGEVLVGEARLLRHAPLRRGADGGPRVPPALLEQLAPGGRLVMPVGDHPSFQELVRCSRVASGRITEETKEAVAFVPLIGAEGWLDPAAP